MAKSRKFADLLDRYQKQKSTYEGLSKTAESILLNLLHKENIPIVSVSSRVKTSESLTEKQRRKRYKNPAQEITDIIGLRVITYTEDDAKLVCALVTGTFLTDASLSIDKGERLKVDQIGYRSYHFVCELGKKRVELPEFQAFKGLRFEVQVRTVLQHAWAEVEHDRNYKFSGILPAALQRRLFLISGVLEMGDRELNQLSRDIDSYASGVEARAREGKLREEELNSTTIRALLREISKALKKTKIQFDADPDTLAEVIDECGILGIKTTTDLKALFTPELLSAVDEFEESTNEAGLSRDALMNWDMKGYFERAWQKHWTGFDQSAFNMLSKKYGVAKVRALLEKFNLEVEDSDFFDGAAFDIETRE